MVLPHLSGRAADHALPIRGIVIKTRLSLRSALFILVIAGFLSLCGWGLLIGAVFRTSGAEQARAAEIPTRAPTRAFGPTKYARLIPTDTPLPTATFTLVPSATPKPTHTPTEVPTRKPATLAPTAAPTATVPPTETPGVLRAAAVSNPVPACAPIDSESYNAFWLNSPPTDRPAASHPDLNLGLRGYEPVVSDASLLNFEGDTAEDAPQLDGLFADRQLPAFKGDYQVYDWNWDTDRRGDLIEEPIVTLIGLAVSPGDIISLPDAGANIGLGYSALVLYASPNRITLKYTGEDNVKRGYTLHLENVCVEPRLLALYSQLNEGGRHQLPALRAGQALGRSTGSELGIAIRDNGTFMDPRSRKDWWRGH